MAPLNKPKSVPKKTLAAIVGTAAAALLLVVVPQFEGTILKGYLDPIGIATKCMGDTTDVVVGKPYTMAECQASLETQLIKHAEPVLACTPGVKGNVYRMVGVVSWAYNIGVGNYCGSTAAKRFNAGDFVGGCRAMNEADDGKPQWVSAGKRPKKDAKGHPVRDAAGKIIMEPNILPGLVKRRAIERKLCEGKTV